MEEQKYINPYTVVLIYDKVSDRTEEDFEATLKRKATTDDDIIYIKNCHNEDPSKDNRYICCIKKNFNDDIIEDSDFLSQNGIAIKKYLTKQDKIGNGMTYGFYIKTNNNNNEKKIIELFKYLQNKGFIKADSYEILFPKPYADGSPRQYITVVFNKINGNYPRSYIRKLKALLNNTLIDNDRIKINWLSHAVLKDIKEGVSKSKPNFKN